MVHDAHVYSQASSYSRAFGTAYRTLLPRLAKRARVLLTVSEHSRQELENHGVFPPGKGHIVYNGADHMQSIVADRQVLTRYHLIDQRFFLSVGNLTEAKNLNMPINAVEAGITGPLPLVIVGRENHKVFGNTAQTKHRQIQFINDASDGELKALYQGATALLMPSLSEGFGLPALEAMMCGCPVVATTAGAVREVCGDAALYADPHQANKWAQAMLSLSDNPDRRTQLAHKGQEHARHFTWKRAATQVLEAIQSAERQTE